MDTASHCVKCEGKCSDVRCNICPRYPYDPTGPSALQAALARAEAADRIEALEAALRKTHTVLFMAQQYRGYEGGPLSEPSAELAEREARAALEGEKER